MAIYKIICSIAFAFSNTRIKERENGSIIKSYTYKITNQLTITIIWPIVTTTWPINISTVYKIVSREALAFSVASIWKWDNEPFAKINAYFFKVICTITISRPFVSIVIRPINIITIYKISSGITFANCETFIRKWDNLSVVYNYTYWVYRKLTVAVILGSSHAKDKKETKK